MIVVIDSEQLSCKCCCRLLLNCRNAIFGACMKRGRDYISEIWSTMMGVKVHEPFFAFRSISIVIFV